MGSDLRYAALSVGKQASGIAPSQLIEEESVRSAGERINDRA